MLGDADNQPIQLLRHADMLMILDLTSETPKNSSFDIEELVIIIQPKKFLIKIVLQ